MRLESEKPHSSLSTHINRYLLIEATAEEIPEVSILPTGYAYLTYIYGRPAFFEVANTQRELPQVFIGGQITGSGILLKPREEFRHLGIEFKPAGLHALLGVDMSITTNSFIDFVDAVGSMEAQKFKSCLDQPIGFNECCRELNSYFMAKNETTPDLTCVQTALKLIENHQGYISMKKLAQESGVSDRQLRRRFGKVCGINPQRYAKIIQLRNVIDLIENKEEYRLTDLAYDSNFFDISHFIKTFQSLVDQNPRDFLESDDDFLQTYMARR